MFLESGTLTSAVPGGTLTNVWPGGWGRLLIPDSATMGGGSITLKEIVPIGKAQIGNTNSGVLSIGTAGQTAIFFARQGVRLEADLLNSTAGSVPFEVASAPTEASR